MKIRQWFVDNVWDKSKLRRALKALDEEKEKSRRILKDSRTKGVKGVDWQNLIEERSFEESMIYE